MRDLVGPGDSAGAPSDTEDAGAEQPAATQPADKALNNRDQGIDWSDPRQVGRFLWRFKVLPSGDTWIEVRQIVIALLVMAMGAWIARFVSKIVQYRLSRISRIDYSAALLIQKLLFWVLAFVVLMIALAMANIPVTFLTVLGGAAAIGIGFGAQNIANNFMSGMILTVEKPIRVGDWVEVSGHIGTIAEIAGRYTRLRRFDGVDVLVPNSHFLEQNVVN